ncbi:hypothetical protein CBR_g40289 [Chara braunii]|uniref:Reverse transcriptase domain-containing protein n=1 Tax=Chara braunii TaxID=69332 RepID=A0A388K1V9_CHABU|nr:hypothetical protein CBR_g40289 [Chara braunii]|eukprot:GBG64042.1 hypothetical protein CBR_g40289 [Chara braunii]
MFLTEDEDVTGNGGGTMGRIKTAESVLKRDCGGDGGSKEERSRLRPSTERDERGVDWAGCRNIEHKCRAGVEEAIPTARERELRELQQVERVCERLERELKETTDREKEIKNRAARLDTLETDKAELEGLDETGSSDPMKVLKNNKLSLHAHLDSRLDFMQSTLDQILDVLTRPGFRPPAQSLLPLTAMSGPFPVQAGTQPSGTSAAVSQTVASSSSSPVVIPTSPQQPVQQSGQPQGQWYPNTPMKPPLAFSGERKDEELNTWLRTVPVWVKAKRTLPEDEVVTAASYLEGKAAKWLDGVVVKAGYGRRMADWAKSLTLDQFMEMVEARWHNPQEAQRATDAINKLDQRKFRSVRELTTTVEALILVSGINYIDQFLLTTFVRCLPENIRNLLASEARTEYHSFETLSRKALDLEATLGNAQPTSGNDSKKKKSPQEWKKKGAKLMMVKSDGTQTEIDELSDLVDYSKCDGEEVAEGSTLAAVVKTKAGGRGMYYLEVAKPQIDWDKKVLKQKLPDGRTVRLTKFKAISIVDSYGCLCASAFYNYYKQNKEEGMYLVYVSEKGEAVKTPPEIERVVAKFPDLFEEPIGVVDKDVVHTIEIISGSKTPKGRIYRMAPAELDELRKQLKELTEKGWIRPSTSPYGSPVLFVPKKGGTLRMCIDYRGLNAITVKNAEPLPRIDDLVDRVQGCKYYTKIDLKSGYHQIAIRPEDQHKTTFRTRYGLYEFVVMPFGLCNAPGTFQHAMNRIFYDHLDKFVVVYLDDILIFSKSAEEHAKHVETVLSLLRQHKYKVNLEKCEFGRTKILYLGHEVSAEGIRPKNAKVASIRDWPRPQTVTEVRSFLGMCGYYRNFVKNYSTVASPLTDLTRHDTPWDWSDECEGAFKSLKHALMNHEVLMVPDLQKPFIVTTDASQFGIGAALAQQDGKKLRPIEYMNSNAHTLADDHPSGEVVRCARNQIARQSVHCMGGSLYPAPPRSLRCVVLSILSSSCLTIVFTMRHHTDSRFQRRRNSSASLRSSFDCVSLNPITPLGVHLSSLLAKRTELSAFASTTAALTVTRLRTAIPRPAWMSCLTVWQATAFSRRSIFQIRVAAVDQPKTAFRSRFGHYEFTVMPFSLTNAPAIFQTTMNDIFRDILEEYVLVYLNYILV